MRDREGNNAYPIHVNVHADIDLLSGLWNDDLLSRSQIEPQNERSYLNEI